MMDLVAGAGGMFGQLAVGLAGGMDSQGGDQSAVMNMAAKMQAMRGTKSTIDSLPDKVIHLIVYTYKSKININKINNHSCN